MRTELFNIMNKIRKEYAAEPMGYIVSNILLCGESRSQMEYILDTTFSDKRHIHCVNNDISIVLPNLNILLNNLKYGDKKCTVNYNGKVYKADIEWCEGFCSVICEGEVVAIFHYYNCRRFV